MKCIIMWQLSGKVDPTSELARMVPPAKGKTALREVLAGRDMISEAGSYHTRVKDPHTGAWVRSGTYAIRFGEAYRWDDAAQYWAQDGDVCDAWLLRCKTVTHTDVSRYLTSWAQREMVAPMRGGVYLMQNDTQAHELARLVGAAGAGTLLVIPQPDLSQAARMALQQLAEECTKLSGMADCKAMLQTVSDLKDCFRGIEEKEADIVAEQVRSRLAQLERGY